MGWEDIERVGGNIAGWIADGLTTAIGAILATSAQWGAGFWGAMIGALVAGGLALYGQMRTIRAAREERLAQKRERDQAMGYALVAKLGKLASGLRSIDKVVDKSLREAGDVERWATLQMLANLPDPIHFTPEEIAFLFRLGNNDLLNRAMMFDDQFNALIGWYAAYRRGRAVLHDLMEQHFVAENWMDIRPKPGMEALCKMKKIELTALADGILTNLKPDRATAESLLRETITTLNDRLGMKLSFALKDAKPDG